jgi:SPP1 gp7 family putative phage head morphogenesis protein
MSSIITASREFRADVLRNDKAMLRQLSSAYLLIAQRLKMESRRLLDEIEAAQKRGETVNRNWLRRSDRYKRLLRQAQGLVGGYAGNTSRFIEAQQRRAIDLGQLHATSLIETALPEITLARLPTGAIEELVGVLANGSPLNKVLEGLGGDVAKEIRETLITGLGSGHGAAKIARGIRKAINVPRWKALQIARTETLRAYRQSTLATYAANDDVLDGWIWTSTLSTRTCAACWALHGNFFPLSKQFFPSHVSCRCTSIPSIKGVKTNVQSGSVVFASLPVDQQQTILGPSRYEMFRAGTPLDDFVILTRDKDWGGAYQVRPLWKMKNQRRAA